ncbi:MAG: family 78 glycoside hydrolase catalytic domain [Victivallales bacterium]|nr:family 78 glycoside hydrolase catalytic domain [Victivallales bacterium]
MIDSSENARQWEGKWIGSTLPEKDSLFRVREANLEGRGAPWLFKVFECSPSVTKARLFIAAPGWHCAYLNGVRIGDEVLSPVITQFNRRIAYISHDVSSLLRPGKNAIAVLLGNGWYNCQSPMSGQFEHSPWRNQPSLLLQLEDEAGNVLLKSDQTWHAAASHITMNALRAGETQDTRKIIHGISLPDFDASGFGYAEIMNPPPGELVPECCEPCRVTERIAPVTVTRLEEGVAVYDFETSVTGWCEIKAEGEAGGTIVLQHGERLAEDGHLDIDDISKFIGKDIFQKDTYILNGEGVQMLHPHFCYHGFRYVQATCSHGATIKGIQAHFIRTDFAEIGQFKTENATLERLQEITRRAYLCNFTGIPTDCPHREKNGWTGDHNIAYETGCFNFDIHRGMENFATMLMDEQRPSGQLPCIAPTGIWGYNWGSGPAWDSFIFEAAAKSYLFAGDDTIMRRHYDGMKRYLEYCRRWHDVDGIVDFGLGDWAHYNPSLMPERSLTSTAFYYNDAKCIASMASHLGKDADKDKFLDLAERIRIAFIQRFMTDEGDCGNNSLTALSTPLFFNMLEDRPELRRKLLTRLLEKLHEENCRANVGILGAKFVPRVLGETGHIDEMVRFLTQVQCPGWGYWVTQGATSLWEHWNGEHSRMHIMFGDVSACMFRYIAGINPTAPGFKEVLLRPAVQCQAVPAFECSYKTPYGALESCLLKCGQSRKYRCSIPKGVHATLHLPGMAPQSLTEGLFESCVVW